MARPKDTVGESLHELTMLEHQYTGETQLLRLTMLRMLREDPSMTLAEVALALDKSERSVQRWWEAYTRGGIDRLLEVGKAGGKRPRRMSDEALETFRHHLRTEGFNGITDAQRWLEERLGVSYSRSRVWSLMRGELTDGKGMWMVHQPVEPFQTLQHEASAVVIPDQIRDFLNSLPVTGNVAEWVMAFREPLRRLLGDVDRISINVNTACNLESPEEYTPGISVVHYEKIPKEMASAASVTVQQGDMHGADSILESLRRQGFPLDQFHSPVSFDYHYSGHAYLGTIFLWNEKISPPVSEQTLRTMGDLRPFFVFALSDLVVRHQHQRPVTRVFHDAFDNLAADSGLSPQERRIIVLQLFGHSYKEMADLLAVTVDTVKKHFKQIHRKTGTRSQSELFAKYFTSRLALPQEGTESGFEE